MKYLLTLSLAISQATAEHRLITAAALRRFVARSSQLDGSLHIIRLAVPRLPKLPVNSVCVQVQSTANASPVSGKPACVRPPSAT